MRKSPFALAAAMLFSRAASAAVPEAIEHANTGVAIEAAARHVSYSEQNHGSIPGAPDVLDGETGVLPGVRLDATVQHDMLGVSGLYVAGYVSYLSGSLGYNGATERVAQDGTITLTPISLTSGATSIDTGIKLGVGIPIGDVAAITPLARWAFRDWQRTVGQGTTAQYTETYTHHELAAGALVQLAAIDRLVLGAEATLGVVAGPHLSNDITSPVTLEMGLGSSVVFAGGLSLDFAAARHVRVVVAYGARFYGYGKSEPVRLPPPNQNLAATEPDSTTAEHELRGGLMFAF